MKKVSIFLSTLLLAGSMISCLKSKEKVCECTTTYSDPAYTPQVQEYETSQECSFYEDSYVSGGLTAVTTCEEK